MIRTQKSQKTSGYRAFPIFAFSWHITDLPNLKKYFKTLWDSTSFPSRDTPLQTTTPKVLRSLTFLTSRQPSKIDQKRGDSNDYRLTDREVVLAGPPPHRGRQLQKVSRSWDCYPQIPFTPIHVLSGVAEMSELAFASPRFENE